MGKRKQEDMVDEQVLSCLPLRCEMCILRGDFVAYRQLTFKELFV